ncbi:MAG TPA: MOSC domain-containing protein [Gaiellaceae bacterium]|nr:MOSC domain-containing protein [Gaiellaceae bacterium]
MTTETAAHLTREELEAGLDAIRRSPADAGTVELIVRRPAENERDVLEEGALDLEQGLAGDMWRTRGSKRTADGSAHPDMQVTVMNVRVTDLVAAGDRERWALAGDQLYVDLDLSEANLPPGTRLALGSAVIEVTDQPHTGCAKFKARFGGAAHTFVNTRAHRHLRLRGLNARVVEPGTVGAGDAIRKL